MEKSKHTKTLSQILTIIGNKWTLLIIYNLQRSSVRFTNLQRAVGGITHKSLSSELKRLEKEGIVSRTVYAEVPIRVEYRLTEKGIALLSAARNILHWGTQYYPDKQTDLPRYTPLDAGSLRRAYGLTEA